MNEQEVEPQDQAEAGCADEGPGDAASTSHYDTRGSHITNTCLIQSKRILVGVSNWDLTGAVHSSMVMVDGKWNN
jgi:hypothetical protein